MLQRILLLCFCLSCSWALAQGPASLSGQVNDETGPLLAATVVLEPGAHRALTNARGEFRFEGLPPGEYHLRVRYLGLRTHEASLALDPGEEQRLELRLKPDYLGLDEVVISSNRERQSRQEATVRIDVIGEQQFTATNAVALSDGLNFTPGLRLETNCQNCGFTQVRMNGLEGPYTQILINSRPIFSALTGVYGLDFIPTNMIERVEVVRGGGSALYGGNAIGGTINIITTDPTESSFQLGSNFAWTGLEAPDHTLSFNGSMVSEEGNAGLSAYGFHRQRDPWDANGDAFSEITQLRNTTFGVDAFYRLSEYSRLDLNVFNIAEFRRGGSDFDRPPHQAAVAEQLDHSILGGSLAWEQFSRNLRHKLTVYASGQQTGRDSYYGGGGRVLQPGDSLTETDLLALNAYGQSVDRSLVTGAQYAYRFALPLTLTLGSEWQYNRVRDEMPGYGRFIDQEVQTIGSFAQAEYRPSEAWTLQLSGRYDRIRIAGDYRLADEDLQQQRPLDVLVPRASVKYAPLRNWQFRLTYAQGYRAPQAFDEDLHIETVGGAARFTRLSPDLEVERSHSYTASTDWTRSWGRHQLQVVVDGFFTDLEHPFLTTDAEELPNGVAVVTKRNGAGAQVFGLNTELNYAFGRAITAQLGGTWQQARYDESEIIWSPAALTETNRDSLVQTRRMLRNPDWYGFFVLTYQPVEAFSATLSGTYTGSMLVPHVIDVDSEFTRLVETPDFLDLGVKVSYQFELGDHLHLQVYAGARNLLNQYQQDFDRGADRDAGYVYGPGSPRSVFFGMTFGQE